MVLSDKNVLPEVDKHYKYSKSLDSARDITITFIPRKSKVTSSKRSYVEVVIEYNDGSDGEFEGVPYTVSGVWVE